MSMYRLSFRRQLIYQLPAFFVLVWLLLAVYIGSSSTVFAAVQQTSQQLPPQNITRAGVTVVRLLVSYTSTEADSTSSNGNTTIMCTGQGVLLSSQSQAQGQSTGATATPGMYENWILTDGNLVNQSKANCLPSQPQAKLAAITIFTSTAYNAQQSVQFVVPAKAISITCQDRTNCANGAALFSFSTSLPQPFVRLAASAKPTAQDGAPDQALVLAKSDFTLRDLPTSSFGSSTYNQQLDLFRTPTLLPASSPLLNSGTPLVNGVGDLTGIHLANGTTPSTSALGSFIHSVLSPSSNHQVVINPVYENWENGMDAYYQQKLDVAHTDFGNAYAANHSFTAAQHFADLTTPGMGAGQQADKQSSVLSPMNSISVAGFTFYFWEIALTLVILILLVVLVVILLVRSRLKRRHRFQSELADADKQATIEAQRIRMAEMESNQGSPSSSQIPAPMAIPPRSPSQPLVSGPLEGVSANVPMQRCPRCGEMNSIDSNYCGHCRQALTPTPSGALPRLSRASAPYPAVSGGGSRPSAPISPAPMPSVSDQPTIVQAGTIAEQPTVMQGPAIVDQPTIDMTPSQIQENAPADSEQTLPYSKRRLRGQHASFAVGARSNPGIKRKYKPNEDSLFAAQGFIGTNSRAAQIFGLFVVADGMGGHANGRDASQLAIQTLINHVLPRITSPDAHMREDYAQLLVAGVQEANMAVHHNNVEQHGDMGTTVTSCLLVDGIAYVANVGDSRTYLYRSGEGLKKVTIDHSVVASLVEAGIIKPDDIYTHPKRHQIYRSLGEKPVIEIDSFTVQMQSGDKLVLCSDGLWDMVRDPKIENVVEQTDEDPSVTGEALIQAALEGGGEDNVSVIVVHMNESFDIADTPRVQLLAKPDSVQMPQLL